MSGTKGNSGGARTGSGQKKQQKTISEAAKRRWVSAARRFKAKHGVTVEDAILALVMKDDIQDYVKVSAAKLYNEAIIAKVTEKNVDITRHNEPAIGLPPVKEDPALTVLVGGKK